MSGRPKDSTISETEYRRKQDDTMQRTADENRRFRDLAGRLASLVSDWEANSGSRGLGERSEAEAWSKAALQLREVIGLPDPQGEPFDAHRPGRAHHRTDPRKDRIMTDNEKILDSVEEFAQSEGFIFRGGPAGEWLPADALLDILGDRETPHAVNTVDERAVHAVVRRAVGGVLFNVSNFPEKAQSRLLGQNMGPLNERITDAVLDALRPSEVLTEQQKADLEEGLRQSAAGQVVSLGSFAEFVDDEESPQGERAEVADLDDLESMMDGAYDLRHVPVEPLRAALRELRALRAAGGVR